MSRPLRIEFAGALYHVTSRGNERRAVFWEEADFDLFISVLEEVCDVFNWVIYAWCLMTNHYHLVIETPDGNLSTGMRQLNGVFTIRFNRKYRRSGHLFQGRYKAIHVDKSAYLLELSRYVVLNPVRARMVGAPEEYCWSSYLYTLGVYEPPVWLAADALLLHFADERSLACQRYKAFVMAGIGINIWDNLQQQVYLGGDAFICDLQEHMVDENLALRKGVRSRISTPSAQKKGVRSRISTPSFS